MLSPNLRDNRMYFWTLQDSLIWVSFYSILSCYQVPRGRYTRFPANYRVAITVMFDIFTSTTFYPDTNNLSLRLAALYPQIPHGGTHRTELSRGTTLRICWLHCDNAKPFITYVYSSLPIALGGGGGFVSRLALYH